jgi:hypothetical protein
MEIRKKVMKKKIVGIASLPERIDSLQDTIESLYHQVDEIIVGLNNYQSVPDFLNREKIQTYLLDNTLGDAAKFYKIQDYPNSYYFCCDDDIIYPDNFCDYLIEKSTQLQAVVGLHGVTIRRPVTSYYKNRIVYGGFQALDKDIEVDLVATSSCLIDTELLNVSILDFLIPNMADIWLGDLCKKNNIKSYAVTRERNWIKYSDKMKDKWTIFDEFKKKEDYHQTSVVSKWKIKKN